MTTARRESDAPEILSGAMEDEAFRASVAHHAGSVEVMLGYSDTSKRMGVLPSRLAINAAMRDWINAGICSS